MSLIVLGGRTVTLVSCETSDHVHYRAPVVDFSSYFAHAFVSKSVDRDFFQWIKMQHSRNE
jgi:hypothetical protein